MRNQSSLLAAALVASLVAARARADLVAHYTFDETGGTTAADSAGSGVTGTLQGGASFVASGIAGNAVSLDRATDGVVNMGDHFGFVGGSFSVSFWLKTTTSEADSVAISKHAAGFNNGYLFPVGPTGGGGAAGKANFTATTNVAQGVTSTTTVNDGTWHQVVGVYNAGGTHSIYVDGAPAEETKATIPVAGNVAAFYVGGVGTIGNATVADGRYTGLIDDLQLYNNALTDADVTTLFTHPGQAIPEPAAALTSLVAGALVLCAGRHGRRNA